MNLYHAPKNIFMHEDFLNPNVFFTLPVSSDLLGIVQSDGKVDDNEVKLLIADVHCKMFAMPVDNFVVFAPLRHAF